MSKMKQIAALTAMLVGVIMYASPAKSAVCFLPDDDGSCGGGDIEISDGSDSDNNKPEEKCDGFTVSATEYRKMKNCFDFTSCTKSRTNEVKYKKGAQKENTTWSNGICCTNGEKYFSKQGQCCPTTGCACSGGRVWNPSTEQCECPEGKEFVGGVCTCAGNTVPDSDGNFILPAGCTYEYRQATTADSCGLTDLNTNYQCASTINGCNCYNQLQKVSSVWVYMTGHVFPYNRISNKSATCVDENNVTRYQTICQGTPKSKCSTGYEFKPNGCVSDTYTNGFEVKGDEWGDCVKKEEKCTYEYTMLTTKDTNGVTDISGSALRYTPKGNQCSKVGDKKKITSTCAGYSGSNGTYRCGGLSDGPECTNPGRSCEMERTCQQYYNCPLYKSCGIKDNPSVYSAYTGSHWDTPYNRISNASASCETLDGVTKYQTICQGTPKSKCPSNKKFTPNKCVSSDYTNGIKVKGDEWGTCGCDTSNGYYDSIETCRTNANSDGCTQSNIYGCYQTCKSKGYYSTEADCKNTNYKVTCSKIDDCYKREIKGFLIKYDEDYKRKAICGHAGYTAEAEAYLETVLYDSKGKEYAGPYPETVDGRAYQELPEDNSKVYQYPAGTYYLCYRQRCTVGGSSTEQSCPNFDLKALRLLRTSDYNPEFTDEVCFTGSGGGYVDKFVTCVNGYDAPNNRHPCKKVTFKAGKTYKVRFIISGANDSSCTYK